MTKEVEIDYTNWKNMRSRRRIVPLQIIFTSNAWHPNTQWLLEATDLVTGEHRAFAMSDIHSWKEFGT